MLKFITLRERFLQFKMISFFPSLYLDMISKTLSFGRILYFNFFKIEINIKLY